jgi:mannitol-1-phosphate/altronate dehydrogenase
LRFASWAIRNVVFARFLVGHLLRAFIAGWFGATLAHYRILIAIVAVVNIEVCLVQIEHQDRRLIMTIWALQGHTEIVSENRIREGNNSHKNQTDHYQVFHFVPKFFISQSMRISINSTGTIPRLMKTSRGRIR